MYVFAAAPNDALLGLGVAVGSREGGVVSVEVKLGRGVDVLEEVLDWYGLTVPEEVDEVDWEGDMDMDAADLVVVVEGEGGADAKSEEEGEFEKIEEDESGDTLA